MFVPPEAAEPDQQRCDQWRNKSGGGDWLGWSWGQLIAWYPGASPCHEWLGRPVLCVVCSLERGGRRPGPGRSGIPGMLSEQTPRRRLWECICPPPTITSCTCTPRTTPARSFRKAVYLGHGLVRTCFYRLPASQLSLHLIAFAYEPQLMRSPLRPFVWF